jgi:hypothetical protein
VCADSRRLATNDHKAHLFSSRRAVRSQGSSQRPPEVIAKSYGLTPTELRVLLTIVEEDSVPEVAEVLGIATETVKPTSVVSIRRPARLVSSILPRSSLDFQIRYSSRLPQSEGSASRPRQDPSQISNQLLTQSLSIILSIPRLGDARAVSYGYSCVQLYSSVFARDRSRVHSAQGIC